MKHIVNRFLGQMFPSRFGVGSARDFLSRERYRMLEQAFMYTTFEEVEGDYLEFGVARGRSLIYAYKVARRLKLLDRVRFSGFDSFQGFPELKGVDKVFERFRQGEERHERQVAERNLRRCGVDLTRVNLVAGWYQDTLVAETRHSLGLTRARIVNIDCDLHESALTALRFTTDLVADGTVLMFDDWFCYRGDPRKGEQRAASDWLAENPHIELIPYRTYANVGMSFIVTMVNRSDDARIDDLDALQVLPSAGRQPAHE